MAQSAVGRSSALHNRDSKQIPNKPPDRNLRELRKQEMLNNLVRVHEEAPVVKITRTKETYDRLLEKKGPEIDYSSDSSDEED